LTESSLVVKSKDKTKIFSPLVTLSLILAGAIIIGTTVMPSELVSGQNATGQMPFEMLSGQMGHVSTEINGTFTVLGNNQRVIFQLNLSGIVPFE
jgi:hypothetical protein